MSSLYGEIALLTLLAFAIGSVLGLVILALLVPKDVADGDSIVTPGKRKARR